MMIGLYEEVNNDEILRDSTLDIFLKEEWYS